MNIPPPDTWLTFKEAAEKTGATYKQLHHAANRGRIMRGERVTLECWRTHRGYVTTADAIKRFCHRLSVSWSQGQF